MPDAITGRRGGGKRWQWIVLWTLLAVCLTLAVGVLLLQYRSPLDRDWAVTALEAHYHVQVELTSFQTRIFPVPSVTGSGLVLHDPTHPDDPPLATIAHFSVQTSWRGLRQNPRRLTHARLTGLVLNVPPHGLHISAGGHGSAQSGHPPDLLLEDVAADGTVLNILAGTPGKKPTTFQLKKLRLHADGPGLAMSYQALLTNPKPIGEIHTHGQFGPWDADLPSATPVGGNYDFEHADLSSIPGLKGILRSTGNYSGTLKAIAVRGETETPDFGLREGRSEALHTDFEALVDGTSGDTRLDSVRARLRNSTLTAHGVVINTPGPGNLIRLSVTAGPAQLADILRLELKTPPLIGTVAVQARLTIPPGSADIAQRLQLQGDFQIANGLFTNSETEDKMTGLSYRAQGHPKNADPEATFTLAGQLDLKQASADFASLEMTLPGVDVRLQGDYAIPAQTLDFHGTAALQAELSQTLTGIKSILARPLDPFTKGRGAEQGAGLVLPLEISGTRAHPIFKVPWRQVFHRP